VIPMGAVQSRVAPSDQNVTFAGLLSVLDRYKMIHCCVRTLHAIK
jgi:hypothetical protein